MTAGSDALRVAALYDIHGNLPALRAVLREIEEESVDLVVVGGDIAWGPLPQETLATLRSLGERALFVRGNADREVAEGSVAHPDPEVAEVTEWCAARLSPEERSFLGNLPEAQLLEVSGIGQALFCHGSPRSDEESITGATPDEELAEIVRAVPHPTIVCGHTHAQFDRRVDGRRVVNAGSVGLPFGRAGAHWALLGPDVTLRVTPYDVESAAEQIRRSGFPGVEGLIDHLSSPPPVEASWALSPRASGAQTASEGG